MDWNRALMRCTDAPQALFGAFSVSVRHVRRACPRGSSYGSASGLRRRIAAEQLAQGRGDNIGRRTKIAQLDLWASEKEQTNQDQDELDRLDGSVVAHDPLSSQIIGSKIKFQTLIIIIHVSHRIASCRNV